MRSIDGSFGIVVLTVSVSVTLLPVGGLPVAEHEAVCTTDANIELLKDLCNTMLNGSLCGLGGMTPFPVLSAMNHFPEDFGISQPAAEKEIA